MHRKTWIIVIIAVAALPAVFYAIYPSLASAQQPPMGPGMMRPMGGAAMAMDATHLYVTEGANVYKINKTTMKIEATLELPVKHPNPRKGFQDRKKPMEDDKFWDDQE